MDQREPECSSEGSRITLPRDSRPAPETGLPPSPRPRPYRPVLATIIAIVGLAAGLAGIGAAAWIYAEGQAETRRLASEIAQLRVSLDLYARGNSQQATSSDGAQLADLANRLAILEQNWRDTPAPAPASPITTQATSSNEDCLPSGMRILVAEGDRYPVCGQPAEVNVAQVADGYLMLNDGTTIASGGSTLLPGTRCTIGVTSGGDEGVTGYAEIRVTC